MNHMLVSRWRSVCVALALLLAFAGLSPTPPVQAAPDNPADIDFEVQAAPEKPPSVCVGDRRTFYVSVNKHIKKTINDIDYDLPRGRVMGGATIYSSMSVELGSLGPAEIPVELVAEADLPGQATVYFTAKKPGSTVLIFNSTVNPKWVQADSDQELGKLGSSVQAKEARIPVKVINCKFKVTVNSKWSAGMTSVATMEGEIKADAQGGFSDLADVNWATSMICAISSPIAPSSADMTGTIDENGELVLKIAFGPASSAGGGSCKVSATTANSMTVATLTVRVPASGGVSRLTQTVKAQNGSFPGSATIIVIPEEDKAAAFNPGRAEARVGPVLPWWAPLWNAFPDLGRASLALR